MVNLETYYSFNNITPGKNNEFRNSPNGGTFHVIQIEQGSYELTGINNYIFQEMKLKGYYDSVNNKRDITIIGDGNTLKSILAFQNNNKVDFSA